MLHENLYFEPPERLPVTSNEEWERQYWSVKFGCAPEHPSRAMIATGASAEEIRQYLQR